jgi:hypothetical protein
VTVQADPLRARGSDVAALADIIARGDFALHNVGESLKAIIRDESWRDFVTKLGKEVHHDRFVDFVTTLPLAGLGTDVRTLLRIVADDPEAQSMLDEATRTPTGVNNINTRRPVGTARVAALRRLRDQRPDLHDEVVAGSISAHAAAVKAGFRPRTFTVRADDPVRAAAVLRRNFTADQIATLAQLLLEG